MKKLIIGILLTLLTTSAWSADLQDFVAGKDVDSSPTSDVIVYCVDDPDGTPDGNRCSLLSTETAYEGFLDLEDLQGAVTDGQVPNDITITDNATQTWVGSQSYLTSYTETDPIYGAWDKSTGISITESQVSDLGTYLTSEVDGSVSNELQDLSLTTNTLSLSDSVPTIDLSGYLDNTTCDGTSCAVTNTGTLDGYEASALLDNTDTQDLDLTTNTLSLTDGGSVDLSGYLDNTDDQICSEVTGCVTGAITGNETITLSGDASGSGTTSIALTIASDAVEESMLKSVNAPTDEYALTYESTTGDFEWQEMTGGSGTPGGSDTQMQYNDGGSFGGSTMSFNDTTELYTITGLAGITIVNSLASDAYFPALDIYNAGGANTDFNIRNTSGNIRFRASYGGLQITDANAGQDIVYMNTSDFDINPSTRNIDLRYSGDTTADIFVIDAGDEDAEFKIPVTIGDGTDFVKQSHDGTDYNFEGTNTTQYTFDLPVEVAGTTGGVTLTGATADPCGTFAEGTLFYNTTSNYMCYCNGTNDVKMSDDSTACF